MMLVRPDADDVSDDVTPSGSSLHLHFEKWEGLGNDFILTTLPDSALTPAEIQRLCDRRRGIGADGLLHITDLEGGHPRMIVRNADGSRPEMCGNGLRCVAAYLRAHLGATKTQVSTDAGDRVCGIEGGAGGVYDVTVEMGVAHRRDDLTVMLGDDTHHFYVVDVGNPHAITFAPYDDSAVDRVGPAIAAVPAGGINVEFCRARDGEGLIDVTVWERGVGRTLACGTGACAVAAAACETGRARFGVPMRVRLPGGDLEVMVDKQRTVLMKGPARRVFTGIAVIR